MELDLGADEVFITASDPSHPGLPLASQTVHPSSHSFSAKSGFRGVVKMKELFLTMVQMMFSTRGKF